MTKAFWSAVLLSPALLGWAAVAVSAQEAQVKNTPVVSSTPIAAPSSRAIAGSDASTDVSATDVSATDISAADVSANVSAMEQVTSVSQLSDVKPTDWAFQALQSLVERYGCIVGYPDKTFRGNRALTRYEFAAGLNACMDRINELIAAGTANLVKKADLETLQKLQEEFAAELATLRGRVDALEARTGTLEKQQFSTTTKLNAEVVFARTGVLAGDTVNGLEVKKNAIYSDRVRLNFDTSFTGKDLLRTRLQAANTPLFSETATFTREGDLRFAGDSGNRVNVDALLYQFPLGDNTTITLEANAGAIDDFTDTVNPYFDGDGGFGALSHFGTRNPIYYLLNGTGIGLRHQFSKGLELSLGYLGNDAANPAGGSGIFNGPYGAIAQLTVRPLKGLSLGLTYIHAYNNDFTANGSTGSNNANFAKATGLPFSTNAFGVEASFQFSPKVVLNGSVGYTQARSIGTGFRGDADLWNWFVGLAFPDLLTKGSIAGILVGMEPRVASVSGALKSALPQDPNTSLHIEGFYQFKLSDNIAITPGIIWLTAPDHNKANDDVVIGTVRTTFAF